MGVGAAAVLMNRYLRQALDAADRTALLEYAADLLSAKASDAPMAVLPSGTTAKLSVADRAQIGSARTNVVFHIRLSAEITVHPRGHPTTSSDTHTRAGRPQQLLAAKLPAAGTLLPRPSLGGCLRARKAPAGRSWPRLSESM